MQWYVNIKSVEWKTSPPVTVGSRFAFVAQFLGRRIAYTYRVRKIVAQERFVMSPDDGLQRRRAVGIQPLAAPVMAAAMRRANQKDLARLKTIFAQ